MSVEPMTTRQSSNTHLKALCLLLLTTECLGFVSPALPNLQRTSPLFSDRFNRDLDGRSRERGQGGGGGEMAAGAILGGLVGGPFGKITHTGIWVVSVSVPTIELFAFRSIVWSPDWSEARS
jgi:hypothetical protein